MNDEGEWMVEPHACYKDDRVNALHAQNQALQEENATLRKLVHADADIDWPDLAKQVFAAEDKAEALQEALAFYAEPRNHEWQQIEHENGERYTKASSLVDEDAGARARNALSPTQETEPSGHWHWRFTANGRALKCTCSIHGSHDNRPTPDQIAGRDDV